MYTLSTPFGRGRMCNALAHALVDLLRSPWVLACVAILRHTFSLLTPIINPRTYSLSPNRPIPDEETRVRIVSGIDLQGNEDAQCDDCMGASESEVSDVGTTFSQFENSDLESAAAMSESSDEEVCD